jgi:uncharacterized protein CbrC (UPF0167 family)
MDEIPSLPAFKYYPDPVADGTVKAEPDKPCLGCSRIRGWIYTGPFYTEKNLILEESLCPWCIANGTAAKKFSATFNYAGTMEDVTLAIREEIEQRTPGFYSWQDNGWLACCHDAAAFLGVAGSEELQKNFPKAIPAVKKHLREDYDLSGDDLQEFFDALTKDDQPTAYVFQCLHCQGYLAYVDQT